MQEEKETTEAKLRRQIAEHLATADALTEKLNKLLAKQRGEKAPPTGLEMLWKAALPMSRLRSSRHLCRVEWNKIPKSERPKVQDMIDALLKFNQCDEWIKDGNNFAQGLHLWIKNRRWEDPPEVKLAPSRYRTAPKPAPPKNPALDRDEVARLLSLKTEDQ